MVKSIFVSLVLCLGIRVSYAFSPDLTAIETPEIEKEFPAGSIDTLEKAKAAQEAVQKARDMAERRSTVATQKCNSNFFVNDCKSDVRKARMNAERRFVAIEAEAGKVIRADKARKAEEKEAKRREEAAQKANPKKAKKAKKASSGMSTRHAKKRRADTAKVKVKRTQKEDAETQNEATYDAKLAAQKERQAKRKAALQRRAKKKAERAKQAQQAQ